MPHDTCRVYRPGVTLHRRIAPTAPCSATYEPGVTVIAQGRKRVDLGRTTFIYGESRYLLTSVDLPIVSQIIEDHRGYIRAWPNDPHGTRVVIELPVGEDSGTHIAAKNALHS